MKAPGFWQKGKGGLKAALLMPLALIYGAGASLRIRMTKPVRVGVPVLCVGNVTAGGTGKTPVVIALADVAQSMGIKAAVVSRGYGGSLAGPVKVEPDRHRASEVGDEPLLIAAHAATWVAKDRVAGARAAAADGAALILLDDGFQNPTLHKDFSVVVVDGGFGFGNGCVMPAGPLREGLASAMQRADTVIVMGHDDAGVAGRIPKTVPVAEAYLQPESLESLAAGTKCVAFAGIGLPQKFFATLRSIGVNVLAEHPFPDHFVYTREDLDRLIAEAASRKASLVTTAKDHVRLPQEFAGRVKVLNVAVEFVNKGLPKELIDRVLGHG